MAFDRYMANSLCRRNFFSCKDNTLTECVKSINNPDEFCVRVASGEALGDCLGPSTVGINIIVPTPDEELSYRRISSLGRRSKVLQI